MKIKAIYLYLLALLWVIVLALLLKIGNLNVTGLGITLSFLTLIFFPGMILWRLTRGKIVKENDAHANWLYVVGLGFGYYFIFNLAGIFLNLTLSGVLYLSFLIMLVLFLLTFYKDRGEFYQIDLNKWKTKTLADWILVIVLLSSSFLAFLVVDSQSDHLIGDGWFHLGILQKIVSGNGLSPHNLWVTKSAVLNPIYAFPVWHILVGELAKILDISIFTALRQVLLPLTILSLIVWYSLMGIIFKNKYLTAVTFLTFLLIFLRENSFYYLSALASPDSLNRLLFLPLILALVVDYLFSEKKTIIWPVIFISLLAIFCGLVHLIQFVYFIFILIVFGLFGLVFIRDRSVLVKLGYLLAGLLIIILPYLLISNEAVSSLLLKNAAAFQENVIVYNTYLGASITSRYAILILPVLALFFKKQKRLVFLVATVVALLAIYWPYFGVRFFFFKYLGGILVERAMANIPTFLLLGVVLFLILWSVDYLLKKIPRWSRFLVSGILIIIFLIPAVRSFWLDFAVNFLFSETNPIFWQGYWWVFGLIVVGTIILYFVFRKKDISFCEPFDKLNFIILTILLFFALGLPYFSSANKTLLENPNGNFLSNRLTFSASDVDFWGGEKTFDFFQSQSRKVFLTDNVTLAQTIPLYSDNFVTEYPYSIKEFGVSQHFFDKNRSLAERLVVLEGLSVDFVIVRHQDEVLLLDSCPENFQKVFENNYNYKGQDKTIVVYQVLK